MDQLEFSVKGSSPEPYVVTLILDGTSLTALCTCPAGTYGNFCKHRVQILEGSSKGVVSDNKEAVKTAASWLPGTDVAEALDELRVAEKDKDPEKKALNTAKRKLARAMNT